MRTLVALILVAIGSPAVADDWYESIHCDGTYCTFYKCDKPSRFSPAQIYENNRGNPNAKIGDEGEGGVRVGAGRWFEILFKSQAKCREFSENMYHKTDAIDEAEKRKLDPYR